MKLGMRMKLAGALSVLMVMLTGSAWADVNSVEQAINNYNNTYGTSLTATVSGTTVTIDGTVLNARPLNLGDITGVTINWKAQMTGNLSGYSSNANFELVSMSGGGVFNIEDGAELKAPGTTNNIHHVFLVRAKENTTNLVINVDGGKLEAAMPRATAIDWDDDGGGVSTFLTNACKININGGEIFVPHGMVAVGRVTVAGNGTGLTGMTFGNDYAERVVYCDFWGECEPIGPYEDISGAIFRVRRGASFTIRDGEILTITSNGEFQNEGTFTINGTVTNKGVIYNKNGGTINNYSGNTLDNQGTLTNNGTINNKSTGRIRSTGTIVNASGVINNEGGVFQSSQTKEEMGGTVTGDVQPISNNSSPSGGKSSGGGCSAGLGMVGLLFAGWAALKNRRA